MARPTEWRRSWNLTQGIDGTSSNMALLGLEAGETLGAVWWTYKAVAGPFDSTTYVPAQSLTMVGLQLYPETGGPLDPLVDAQSEGWLWWEMLTWETTSSASTDLIWLHYAKGPRGNGKAEGMRKADPAGSVLAVSMRTDAQDATAAFVDAIRLEVAVSALVILPA